MNLQTLLNVHISNGFSDGRVDNIVYFVDVFDLRPNDTMTVLEERWKCAAGNVAVFVDCRREDGAAVFLGTTPDNRCRRRKMKSDMA